MVVLMRNLLCGSRGLSLCSSAAGDEPSASAQAKARTVWSREELVDCSFSAKATIVIVNTKFEEGGEWKRLLLSNQYPE